MKKVLFAIQVFGLIGMFPLYVIVELNRGTKPLPVNSPVPVVFVKPVIKDMQPEIKSKVENEHAVLITRLRCGY